MSMLNREEIGHLVKTKNLISGYIDLATQLTPNGFDLTVFEISRFDSAGALDFSNKERKLSAVRSMTPVKKKPEEKFGWWDLAQGAYKIVTNETVSLPRDLIAVAYPRSSLLRMGCFTQTATWDAGFSGKSEFILVVANPRGVEIKQNARVAQLVFIKINPTEKGYDGIYNNKS